MKAARFELFGILAILLIPAVIRGQDMDSNIELLRADVRAEKVAILGQAMDLTEEEASAFWPIQREYEGELAKLYDERVALIKAYAESYESMSDEVATDLAESVLDMEKRRIELKERYFERMSIAVSPSVAARFLQIDNQINMLIDLQIAGSLPLIPRQGVPETDP
jgi:hypothetical protein